MIQYIYSSKFQYFVFYFTAIPIIILQPVGATVYVGADEIEMNCSAIGHSRISYHWERHNFNTSEWSSLAKDHQTDINGVSTYTLMKIGKNDEGMYRCAATNIDGSGYSDNATITVYGMQVHTYLIIYTYNDIICVQYTCIIIYVGI